MIKRIQETSKGLNYTEWASMVRQSIIFKNEKELWLKGLQDHPEWAFQTSEDLNETVLHNASYYEQTEIVLNLIQAGADLNAQDKNGWTALMIAAVYNYKDLVKVLLKEGVDLNLQEKDGWTALMMASANGHVEIVQDLMNHGADPKLINQNKYTALGIARKKSKEEVIVFLEACASMNELSQVQENFYQKSPHLTLGSGDHNDGAVVKSPRL